MKKIYLKPNYAALIIVSILLGSLIPNINFKTFSLFDILYLIFAIILLVYLVFNIINIVVRRPMLILDNKLLIYKTTFNQKIFELKEMNIRFKKIANIRYLEFTDKKSKVIIYKEQFENIDLNQLDEFVYYYDEKMRSL